VWRLPLTAPSARGKALVNLLPLETGERITTIMPLPEDEALWESLQVMFATSSGSVRRNNLSDCVPRTSLGKRVMELDGDQQSIVDVQLCSEAEDVLLTTSLGQCIRFPVADVRVFGGGGSTGTSVGNRGISLGAGDEVISMSILRHFEATPAERSAYLKMSRAVRGEGEPEPAIDEGEPEEQAANGELSQERYAEMGAAEQFVLTVSENGYGKRTSSFEYRITRRGGKGIVAMVVNERNGKLVASFPVDGADEVMLVTDGGQTIRMPVEGEKPIRIVGRGSQGVILFDIAPGEKVVSVERIPEQAENGESGEGNERPDEGSGEVEPQ
jgi:DNA gyrase subunit A